MWRVSILEQTKTVRVSNAVSVGTSTVTSSAVDTAGFGGCMFLVLFGAITDGTPDIKVQQSSDDAAADAYADLAGTAIAMADTDDNDIGIVDVKAPKERYLKCVVTRGGSTGCVIDGILAVLYDPSELPVTQDSTVPQSEKHAAPDEGTA